MSDPFEEFRNTQEVSRHLPQKVRKQGKGSGSQLSRAWGVSGQSNKPQGVFRVTLPYPPNQNHSLKARAVRVRGKWIAQVYHSAEAKAFLAKAKEILRDVTEERRQKGEWFLYEGVVRLELDFYHKTDRDDWDGVIKKVSDALQGFAYPDDRQVRQALINNYLDRENPRVEVRVMPL